MDLNVNKIANLCQLKINDDEVEEFKSDMKAFIEMLSDLPEIEEKFEIRSDKNMILRKDEIIANDFSKDELMKNAAVVNDGYFVVPKIV